MSTLAEFMIVADADNHPPMLDKSMHESWKSHMELYIQGKDHGRILLNSVVNGPLIWPTVEQENGTLRPKTYEELSDKEKLQADYDLKATNIVLQGLPPDVYSLVNHHRVSKEIWDRGETLYEYYLWFAQLINDMNIINMTMQPVQLNTKFLNSLLPEWSKLVTDVNHTQPSVPQNAYPPPTIPQQPQAEFPQLDSGLTVLAFLPSDDLIACMNKAMEFLSAVFSPRYPSTNNQLRSSSKPRNQATVQDGRVNVQQVQERKGLNVASSGSQGNALGLQGNTSGQAKAKGKELDEEQLAFLADPGVADGQVA
ncbi:hypothetical protein Tco_0404635 [Tanacetum coccineum]